MILENNVLHAYAMDENNGNKEKKALSAMAAACSKSEHCSYDIEQKLKRWELDEEATARIMEYLIKNKFIDDERYARAMAKDKLRYNKWGSGKLRQALWLKRIPKDICDEVMAEISDADYLSVLRPLIRSKQRSVKAGNDYEARMKVVKYALGRGFSFRLIRQCIDADEMEFDDEEDIL